MRRNSFRAVLLMTLAVLANADSRGNADVSGNL